MESEERREGWRDADAMTLACSTYASKNET